MTETRPKRSSSRRTWGSVRRLKSGRWQARYQPHPGAAYVTAPMTFRLKSEADAWLAETRADLTRGDWTDPTLAQVEFETYASEWIETRPGLKPSTRDKYRYRLAKYIAPFKVGPTTFGATSLGHCRPEMLRRWHASLDRIPPTQARCYRLVRSIFAMASRRALMLASRSFF